MWNNPDRPFFVIFAHARSGSDNLCRALDRHPLVEIVNEPFNENYPGWAEGNVDFRSRVIDAGSLNEQCTELARSFSGMKTLEWNLPRELNYVLLANQSHPVLFLRRRNLLEAVVSHWVARETDLWQAWHAKRPLVECYRDLPPAPIDQLRQTLDELAFTMDGYAAVVAQRDPGTYLSLTYEDLYQGPLDRRRAIFAKTTEFLGFGDLRYDAVSDLMGPRGKLNSAATYSFIPNLTELNQALSNDETGRLTVPDAN